MQAWMEVHPGVSVAVRMLAIAAVTYLVLLIVKKLWRKNPHNRQVLFRRFVFNIMRTLICLAGALLMIGQLPQLSSVVQTILAGSGILVLAVSLSAQESLNNIISGLFITLFKPFEVGDRVTMIGADITGNIEDITLRHTIIKTFTNTRIVVPNATMNKEIVENSHLIDTRASAFVDVTVSYASDIDKAIAIMAEVIGSHPAFLDRRTDEEKAAVPKVQVYVRELGSTGIALRANMWTRTVDENFSACSDVRLRIKKEFDAAGIEIPYFTVWQAKGPAGIF